jgi:tetratricopeptide (TPR) repeat protein
MPRYSTSDIVHTASTDHRIVRRPGPPPREGAGEQLVVASFFPTRAPHEDPEAARDLGFGLAQMIEARRPGAQWQAGRAAGLLRAAVKRAPGDVDAWEGLALALTVLGRHAEAQAAYAEAAERAPLRERPLIRAAEYSQRGSQTERALGYWRQAVKANPANPYSRGKLAGLLAKGAPEEARAHCRAWLELEPASVPGRLLWIALLLRQGKRAEARTELDTVRRLAPDLPGLEEWFSRQSQEESG